MKCLRKDSEMKWDLHSLTQQPGNQALVAPLFECLSFILSCIIAYCPSLHAAPLTFPLTHSPAGPLNGARAVLFRGHSVCTCGQAALRANSSLLNVGIVWSHKTACKLLLGLCCTCSRELLFNNVSGWDSCVQRPLSSSYRH